MIDIKLKYIKNNILFTKKFIVFLCMILSYVVSYSAPEISSDIRIKKETEQNFLIETLSKNPIEYYIIQAKSDTQIEFYENKNDVHIVSAKIKDFFITEEYFEYSLPHNKNFVSKYYNIATDTTRSMRN